MGIVDRGVVAGLQRLNVSDLFVGLCNVIAYASAGEKHLDQERSKRAHGEQEGEAEGDEQADAGSIAQGADKQQQRRQACRGAAKRSEHDGGVEKVRPPAQIRKPFFEPFAFCPAGRVELFRQVVDAVRDTGQPRGENGEKRGNA